VALASDSITLRLFSLIALKLPRSPHHTSKGDCRTACEKQCQIRTRAA